LDYLKIPNDSRFLNSYALKWYEAGQWKNHLWGQIVNKSLDPSEKTASLIVQMASHPGANPAGNYLGFEMKWATESTTTMATLKDEIDAYGDTLNL